MEPDFWEQRWAKGEIGFHSPKANEDLVELGAAWLGDGRRTVLVPLCGKSLDLHHLSEQGHEVIGVELIETALEGFFADAGWEPKKEVLGPFIAWRCAERPNLLLLQGNIFDLSEIADLMEKVDRVWDRASLVALDAPRRAAYAELLGRLLHAEVELLLNVFDHGPDQGQGPPHSVCTAELDELFPGVRRELAKEREVSPSPGMAARGVGSVRSRTWRLRPGKRAAGKGSDML
jgi:thiopurine S-methyltransferase